MDAAVGLVVGDLVGQVQVRWGTPGHAAARDECGRDDDLERYPSQVIRLILIC
jgi:hypothetical protein